MATILDSLNELLKAKLAGGSALAIVAAFLLGVFVGFTPCVYPVLPLTVAYIGSIAKGSKFSGLGYSLVYVLGMALVYAAIGVISIAVFKGHIGAIWSNGWALLALANFFLLLALWQLHVIRIPVPQFMQGASGRRRGVLGALLVGAAAGLVVGPCMVPGLAVMVALIVTSAHQGAVGSLAFGAIAMFAYSLGLGSLIILCGTFSGVLANIPKSGAWLGRIEKAFAVLMILVAEYFLIFLGQNSNFPSLSSLAPALGREPPPSSSGTAQPPAPAPAASGTAAIGGRAPDWQLNGLDGAAVKMGDYRGRKGVLMVFFATWCAPCIAETPRLIAFQEKYKDRRVELLGVDYDQPLRTVKRFAEERKVNYKLVVDTGLKVAGAYGVIAPPTFIGIDAAGIIRYKENELPADLDALVKQLEAAPAGARRSDPTDPSDPSDVISVAWFSRERP